MCGVAELPALGTGTVTVTAEAGLGTGGMDGPRTGPAQLVLPQL